MNPEKAARWLSMALDNELPEARRTQLERYLEQHPELVQLRQQWQQLGEHCRRTAPAPDQTPAAAWQDVQRALRQQNAPREAHATILPLRPRWGWLAAAAAVLIMAGVWGWNLRSPSLDLRPIALADRTQVEWVETDLPDAMSMVYEDSTTGLTVIWVMTSDNGEEDEHAG